MRISKDEVYILNQINNSFLDKLSYKLLFNENENLILTSIIIKSKYIQNIDKIIFHKERIMSIQIIFGEVNLEIINIYSITNSDNILCVKNPDYQTRLEMYNQLEKIIEEAEEDNHCLVFMGDFNNTFKAYHRINKFYKENCIDIDDIKPDHITDRLNIHSLFVQHNLINLYEEMNKSYIMNDLKKDNEMKKNRMEKKRKGQEDDDQEYNYAVRKHHTYRHNIQDTSNPTTSSLDFIYYKPPTNQLIDIINTKNIRLKNNQHNLIISKIKIKTRREEEKQYNFSKFNKHKFKRKYKEFVESIEEEVSVWNEEKDEDEEKQEVCLQSEYEKIIQLIKKHLTPFIIIHPNKSKNQNLLIYKILLRINKKIKYFKITKLKIKNNSLNLNKLQIKIEKEIKTQKREENNIISFQLKKDLLTTLSNFLSFLSGISQSLSPEQSEETITHLNHILKLKKKEKRDMMKNWKWKERDQEERKEEKEREKFVKAKYAQLLKSEELGDIDYLDLTNEKQQQIKKIKEPKELKKVIKNHFEEYFKKMVQEENTKKAKDNWEEEIIPDLIRFESCRWAEKLNTKIDDEEISNLLPKLNLNAAKDKNNINTLTIYYIFKYTELTKSFILNFFNRILERGEVPKTNSFIKVIKKKPSKPWELNNLRPITIMDTLMKVFVTILTLRINQALYKAAIDIPNEAFLTNRSIFTNLYNLQKVMEDMKSKKEGYIVSYDISKAYDSVDMDVLKLILTEMKFTPIMVKLLTNLNTNHTLVVKTKFGYTSSFRQQVGLAQGSPLSTLLFVFYCMNLYDKVDKRGKLRYKYQKDIEIYPLLSYADDMIVMANSLEDLIYLNRLIMAWAHTNKLKINTTKSNILWVSRPKEVEEIKQQIRKEFKQIEVVDKGKSLLYLGKLFNLDEKTQDEENFMKVRQMVNLNINIMNDNLNIKTFVYIHKQIINSINYKMFQLRNNSINKKELVKLNSKFLQKIEKIYNIQNRFLNRGWINLLLKQVPFDIAHNISNIALYYHTANNIRPPKWTFLRKVDTIEEYDNYRDLFKIDMSIIYGNDNQNRKLISETIDEIENLIDRCLKNIKLDVEVEKNNIKDLHKNICSSYDIRDMYSTNISISSLSFNRSQVNTIKFLEELMKAAEKEEENRNERSKIKYTNLILPVGDPKQMTDTRPLWVFTDGSWMRETGKGAAAVLVVNEEGDITQCKSKNMEDILGNLKNDTLALTYPLFNITSSFDAELSAILKALLITPVNRKVYIITDSKSSIDAINKFKNKINETNVVKMNNSFMLLYINHILTIKAELGYDVEFIHVRSHQGGDDFFSIGNSIVDHLCEVGYGDNEMWYNELYQGILTPIAAQPAKWSMQPLSFILIPKIKLVDKDHMANLRREMKEKEEKYIQFRLNKMYEQMIQEESYIKSNIRQFLKKKYLNKSNAEFLRKKLNKEGEKHENRIDYSSIEKHILYILDLINSNKSESNKVRNKKITSLLLLLDEKLDVKHCTRDFIICYECNRRWKERYKFELEHLFTCKSNEKKMINLINEIKDILISEQENEREIAYLFDLGDIMNDSSKIGSRLILILQEIFLPCQEHLNLFECKLSRMALAGVFSSSQCKIQTTKEETDRLKIALFNYCHDTIESNVYGPERNTER